MILQLNYLDVQHDKLQLRFLRIIVFELELYNKNNVLLDTLIPIDHDVGRYQSYLEIFSLNQNDYLNLAYIKFKIIHKNYLDYILIN